VDDGAYDIFIACILAHEQAHFPHTQSCDDHEGERPPVGCGGEKCCLEQYECEAILAEIACLKQRKSQCQTQLCIDQIEDLIDTREQQSNDEKHCGCQPDPSPTPPPDDGKE
jgi:hypothetical protein